MIYQHATALIVGFILDLALGDPHSLPHPVRLMGRAISALERPLRQALPATKAGERTAGVILAALVAGGFCTLCIALLALCACASPWLALAAESVLCYQMLATRSLMAESDAVRKALVDGSLDEARRAVSMIVGRDTDALSEEGVAKAAVETVAENTSDGVVAPLLYMALFGAPGAVLYKAVNTLDSMVGYHNERYENFGWASARLDDALNFVPARLAGLLMVASAFLVGLDGPQAWRIFKRDRRAHTSPNAAHTEAACAGALGVQLAGGACYFGRFVPKPAIGDSGRAVTAHDITLAHRLLYATALLAFALCAVLSLAVANVTGGIL